LSDDEFNLKKFLFGKMSRKLTFLFLVVGIIAPTIGIVYFTSEYNSYNNYFFNCHKYSYSWLFHLTINYKTNKRAA